MANRVKFLGLSLVMVRNIGYQEVLRAIKKRVTVLDHVSTLLCATGICSVSAVGISCSPILPLCVNILTILS